MIKQPKICTPDKTTVKIKTSLALIQSLCNQLLTHYDQLSPPEIIDLIEVIELQTFLLQELLGDGLDVSHLFENNL